MEKYIVSLGGSLIFPERINQEFLKDFKGVIEKYISKGDSFGIVLWWRMDCKRVSKGM